MPKSACGAHLGSANKIKKRGTGRRRKPWLQGWGVAREGAPQETPALATTCQGTGWCKAWSSRGGNYQRICGGYRQSLLFLPFLILAWWTMFCCPGVEFCAAGPLGFHTGDRAESPTFCWLGTSRSVCWSTKSVHPFTMDKVSFD